jgi:hypothetical protein
MGLVELLHQRLERLAEGASIGMPQGKTRDAGRRAGRSR